MGLPATIRSGAAGYYTLMEGLPDYMSFEEKHKIARSGGLMMGLTTGVITSIFSLRGFGGAESIVQRTVSNRHVVEALRKLKVIQLRAQTKKFTLQ